MLKLLMAAFVATVCWLTTAHASQSTKSVVSVQVDCASLNGGYTECDAGTAFVAVELVSETSRAGVCQYGSTWGEYNNSVWVNHGCSGRFEVTVDSTKQPTPAPQPQPVPPQRPLPVTLVDCRYNATNWQPFYRANASFIGRPGFGFQDANTCVQAVQMSRHNAICNWVGNGFTPYDIESNSEVIYAAYPDLGSCYAAIP